MDDLDLARLRAAGVKPTEGDARCIVSGHLTRMAIWNLRLHWNSGRPTIEKIDKLLEGEDGSKKMERSFCFT